MEDPSTTTYAGLKRKYQGLEQDHAELLELFHMLKYRPPHDAQEILNRIRTDSDFHSTYSFIKDGDLLVQARFTTRESQSSMLPSASSPVEAFLNFRHANAFPALPPLDYVATELGPRLESLLITSPSGTVTAQDIENAK
jgi:hypothetical protein